jgi:hypothetical protein
MSAVLAPDKKMQKLDGSKRLGPCTHPQHVKISSEIEVLGPRNGCSRGQTSSKTRLKPSLNKSISAMLKTSKFPNDWSNHSSNKQQKITAGPEPEENQLEDLEFQLSPFLWG